MNRRTFFKNTALIGAGIATAAVVGTATSAEASVSIHSLATVKGFWPEYRGMCPCGAKGTWGSKNHGWAWVDQHQINNGLRPTN